MDLEAEGGMLGKVKQTKKSIKLRTWALPQDECEDHALQTYTNKKTPHSQINEIILQDIICKNVGKDVRG